MSDFIRLLPDRIANQIAAGEVVQRPASVVTEMMENSLDADASHIQLIIKDVGKSLIQVIDNGKGMSQTDARMSFERHATSKIKTSEDLFKIKTLGFRGEALASIAAVSRVEMKTKVDKSALGTRIVIEASKIKSQDPAATSKGTSIVVKNLFYNVPARRNFLKSNTVELRHILDNFTRIALSNPAVSFDMFQNNKQIFKLGPGKLSHRIVQIFGKNYQHQLIPCSEETSLVKVHGYIGKPSFSKKIRGEQFFFINQRYIKNHYLNHAVLKGYQELLKEHYFPFYVLNIEMNPNQVDINVHPTKTEVKFEDDQLLYGVVHSAVRRSLSSFNVSPSLDFSTEVSFVHLNKKRIDTLSKKDQDYAHFKTLRPEAKRLEKLNDLYAAASEEALISTEKAQHERIEDHETITSEQPPIPSREIKDMYCVHNKFLIHQVKSGMMMVDIGAALERIWYESCLNTTTNNPLPSQSCLFSTVLQLNPSDFSLIGEIKSELLKLGFNIALNDNQQVKIQGIPSMLAPCNENEVFEDLIQQFKENQSELSLPKNTLLAHSFAKRMATQKRNKLNKEEVKHLVDELFACEQPNFAPDGNRTFVLFNLAEMSDWFEKKE